MADPYFSLPRVSSPRHDPDHDDWSFTGLSPSPYVPEHKNQLIDQQDWQRFNDAFAALDGTDRLQQYVASRLYAEEGGRRWNGSRSAYAGIQQAALAEAQKRDPALGGLTLGEGLTDEQIARIYATTMAAGARRYGGFEALARLNHDGTVAAIVDTQFRHGQNDGAKAIRDAVSEAKKALPEDVRASLKLPDLGDSTGPEETLRQLRQLGEAGYGALFRGALAELRKERGGEKEKPRYDRYR
ncbi:hypothetical protein [Ferrovibrio sp.]|uniref:hypothetical protein n=1 Tax=Ferrovibrio sp. TaxID=1917215 RepID=UPI002636D2D8|nr:hypothetical protein [Ferrovibrio sp.]